MSAVKVSPLTLSLVAGGAAAVLTATVEPANAANQAVTWESSAPLVAKVVDGLVTPLTPGPATITVKTKDGNKIAACQVTVTPVPVAVTSVDVNPKTLNLTAGGATATLAATVAPADATDKTVTWESSAPLVATVVGGVVTPLAAGPATITVRTQDGNKTAACQVTVTAVVPVATLKVSPTAVNLYVGGATQALTATVTPTNATDKSVTWETDSPLVASVSQDGVVTPEGVGKAIITVKTADGSKSALCEVWVTYVIGSTGPAGGKIFYDAGSYITDSMGKSYRYMECAPIDQSRGLQWYNGKNFLIPTEGGIGTGAKNTQDIIAAQGSGGYAAQICSDLVLGGYSDWFLPSADEFSAIVNTIYRGDTTFTGSIPYWTSTGSPAYSDLALTGGMGLSVSKSNANCVRAIRSF